MPRYIDADALLVSIQPLRSYTAECIKYQIRNAPTISPDDVRGVGEWIDCPSTHIQDGAKYKMCSVCNEHIAVLGHDLDYCPSCGARMKGAEDG